MSLPYDNKAIILDFEDEVKAEDSTRILAPYLPNDTDAFLDKASRSISDGNSFEFIDHGTVFLYELGIAIVYPSLTQLDRQLEGPSENPSEAKLNLLQSLDGVKNVSLDQPVELCNTWADTVDFTWGLQATKASNSSFDGAGIKVGIIDSGVDFQDSNLVSNVVEQANFAFTPECRGEIPDVAQRNKNRYADVWDEVNHGTHVSSILSLARQGERQRYSVAPRAEIYIARGTGLSSYTLRAINWMLSKKVDIINMSFRINRNIVSAETKELFDRVGKTLLDNNILPIAATGNDSNRNRIIINPETGREESSPIIQPVGYPAASEYYLSVGAIDEGENLSSYSNGYVDIYSEKVDLVAPGDNVNAAGHCDQFLPQSGTSMACPHVSGVAALWAQTDSSLRGRKLKDKLISKAKPLGGGDFGAGLVQAP